MRMVASRIVRLIMLTIGEMIAACVWCKLLCTCCVAIAAWNLVGMASLSAVRTWCAMPKSLAFRACPAVGEGIGERNFNRVSSSKHRSSTHELSTTCSRRPAKSSNELLTPRTASFNNKSGQASQRSSSATSTCTYFFKSWEVGNSSVSEESPAEAAPVPPSRCSRLAAILSKSLLGNISSTGSWTRLRDSVMNSFLRSPAAAMSASRSAALKTWPCARVPRLTLSTASANVRRIFGHSDSETSVRRKPRSEAARVSLAFKLPVASPQKWLVKDDTPSACKTEEKLRCVRGSVLERTISSSKCTRCVCITRTCMFTSNACWKAAPAGSAVWENSSSISRKARLSCGHKH
mmetsp:Transcript_97067/g.280135  ORF Transcript_97067/g.280135 Transcript_97067/m.280135 type:complete len:349 (+) Transcript_97067:293-1339(+)